MRRSGRCDFSVSEKNSIFETKTVSLWKRIKTIIRRSTRTTIEWRSEERQIDPRLPDDHRHPGRHPGRAVDPLLQYPPSAAGGVRSAVGRPRFDQEQPLAPDGGFRQPSNFERQHFAEPRSRTQPRRFAHGAAHQGVRGATPRSRSTRRRSEPCGRSCAAICVRSIRSIRSTRT